jgi:chaperonin cofactor prefoldin
MTLLERIQALEDGITLDGDYEYEQHELQAIEEDIPVYRRLGTPVWKTQEAKQKISEIREWIMKELENRAR